MQFCLLQNTFHFLLICNIISCWYQTFSFLFHSNIFPAALSFKTLPDKKYKFLSIQRFVLSPDTSSNDSWWVPSNIQDIRNIQNMKNINYWSTATSEIGDDFWFSFWEVRGNFSGNRKESWYWNGNSAPPVCNQCTHLLLDVLKKQLEISHGTQLHYLGL